MYHLKALESKMALSPDALGRFGETLAMKALRKKGFKILARNWCSPVGELDLVARHRKTLVFVEVKTRRCSSPYPPEAAVDGRKQIRLRRAAQAYLARHPFQRWKEVRFDVVAVSVNQEDAPVDVQHFPDAF